MCDICRCNPCASACPNGPDVKEYGICQMCKNEIIDGDDYIEVDGKLYHLECLGVCDLLDILDIRIMEAGE